MNKAEEMFDAYMKHQGLEIRMEGMLAEACDFDACEENTPWEWLAFDYYDNSFEFKNVISGWKPTEEQWAKCWALGFSRCWICYKEGTEQETRGIYYSAPSLKREFPSEP
jgi:hypothetical protein